MLEHITKEAPQPAEKAIIWLHGLGADGHDFAAIAPQLQQNSTRFIFPHAKPRPIAINGNYVMRAWFDIHGLALDSRVDWQGLAESEQEVVKLIEDQAAKGIPYHKIYLAGFSQGGVVAIYTALRFAKKLGGVIGLSTFLPIQHPIDCNPANQDTPFFMAHGTQDDIVPFNFGEAVAQWLITKDYPVTWQQYPMAHQVCPQEIFDLMQWLNTL